MKRKQYPEPHKILGITKERYKSPELLEGEEKKQITEFPEYYITNLGRLISFRKFPNCDRQQNMVLIGTRDSDGYKTTILTSNSKRVFKRIHRLVATYFLGLEESNTDIQVNHLNLIKTDNRLVNLELCSLAENRKHAVICGQHARKLTEKDINDIFNLWNSGEYSLKRISQLKNVNISVIWGVLNKTQWKHIEREKTFNIHLVRNLSEKEKEEIKKLYFEEKWDTGQIGKKFNFDRRAISNFLNKESTDYKEEVRKRWHPLSEEDAKNIINLYRNQGYTQSQIGELYGRHRISIGKIIRKYKNLI